MGRRSVYIEVRRNFLDPFLLAFDGPIPASTAGRRTISNVPAQSLALMNDPFVQQQARLCAWRVLDVGESPDDRIRYLYRAMFSRQPVDAEVESAFAFLRQQEQAHAQDDALEPEVNAWADLAHVLFMSKEFVFVR